MQGERTFSPLSRQCAIRSGRWENGQPRGPSLWSSHFPRKETCSSARTTERSPSWNTQAKSCWRSHWTDWSRKQRRLLLKSRSSASECFVRNISSTSKTSSMSLLDFQKACIWRGFHVRDNHQDSTDNSSIDKDEASLDLERQEQFSQFQDTLLFCLVTSIFLCALNHGPSQQSCKEEFEALKWGATARIIQADSVRLNGSWCCTVCVYEGMCACVAAFPPPALT